MDGDIVNLPNLLDLAKKYKAMTYIDDAHATGILGKNGGGTEDYFNVHNLADFVMGTFTKSFGGVGGFITSKKEVIEYLKIAAKTLIFTAPIAPPVACGLIESVRIVRKEPWRRETLLKSADYLREGLKSLGYNTLNSQTQIIPVVIGDEKKAMKVSNALLEYGILTSVARWPAVERGLARLRLSLMALHTKDHLDQLLGAMKDIKNKIKI